MRAALHGRSPSRVHTGMKRHDERPRVQNSTVFIYSCCIVVDSSFFLVLCLSIMYNDVQECSLGCNGMLCGACRNTSSCTRSTYFCSHVARCIVHVRNAIRTTRTHSHR